MEPIAEQKIYGVTGEIGRDGVLSPDIKLLLERKQHEASDTVLKRLEQREPKTPFPIAAMATGVGKTRVEHEVIEAWRRKNPEARILFVAGTKLTLVKQAHAALESYQKVANGGDEYVESEDVEGETEETSDVEEAIKLEQENVSFYRVGRFKDKDADVRIATIQTLQSAYKRGVLNPAEFDLVIIDEVHNIGTPQRVAVVNQFSNVIGFTATPHRHSGSLKDPDQYGFEVAYNFPLPEAQEARILPPLLGMQVATTGLLPEVPMTPNGQIDYGKLEKILKDSPKLRPFIADKVASIIKDGNKEYKTVIAVNFVWEAEELARLLKSRGIKVGVAVNQQAAKQVHTDEIPALDSIDRYKLHREDANSIQVLISPYVASEGFDAPFTEVLVWASPTDSPLRYTQYVGRLARRTEGKLFGLNLDFLYQTSQYRWSFNMGMWMKGDIKQLPNGLLYLGPEQDIAGLTDLEVVKAIRNKGDQIAIADLQKEGIEELQETDLALTHRGLKLLFAGHAENLILPAAKVKEVLEKEHPEYFVIRRRGVAFITVVTAEGREAFIQAMQEAGIKLKSK